MVASELRPGGRESLESVMKSWENNALSRGNHRCKGPEVGQGKASVGGKGQGGARSFKAWSARVWPSFEITGGFYTSSALQTTHTSP